MTTGTDRRVRRVSRSSDQQSPDQSPIDRFKKWLLGQVSSDRHGGRPDPPRCDDRARRVIPLSRRAATSPPGTPPAMASGYSTPSSLHVTNHILSNENGGWSGRHSRRATRGGAQRERWADGRDQRGAARRKGDHIPRVAGRNRLRERHALTLPHHLVRQISEKKIGVMSCSRCTWHTVTRWN